MIRATCATNKQIQQSNTNIATRSVANKVITDRQKTAPLPRDTYGLIHLEIDQILHGNICFIQAWSWSWWSAWWSSSHRLRVSCNDQNFMLPDATVVPPLCCNAILHKYFLIIIIIAIIIIILSLSSKYCQIHHNNHDHHHHKSACQYQGVGACGASNHLPNQNKFHNHFNWIILS